MGRRFAEFDWAAHPLGRPQDWQAEVRAAVAVALTSRFPIVLWLGAGGSVPDVQRRLHARSWVTGTRRRWANAAEHVWWDIWQPISPMLASVIATGEATWSTT